MSKTYSLEFFVYTIMLINRNSVDFREIASLFVKVASPDKTTNNAVASIYDDIVTR